MNIAIIGYGRMAREYKRVIKRLNHKVCCFMKQKEVLEHITPIVYNLNDLYSYEPDAIIIAVSQEETIRVLYNIRLNDLGIPLLVEKPVMFTDNDFKQFGYNPDEEHIRVGYNRRFYDVVNEIKVKIKKTDLNSVYVNLPEPIKKYKEAGIKELDEYPLHYSASHVIDLLFYLLGHVRIECMDREKYGSFIGILKSREGVSILLNINFNAPAHTEMTFNFEDEIWTLCPIEELRIFDKLIKRNDNKYYRNINKEIIENNNFKPGLLEQVKQFLYFNKDDNLATLEDARKVSNLCNEIIYGKEYN